MKIKFSLAKSCNAGETIGQHVTINLRYNHSERELIDSIIHESIHAVLNKVAQSKSNQDHYILKRLEINWF